MILYLKVKYSILEQGLLVHFSSLGFLLKDTIDGNRIQIVSKRERIFCSDFAL